MAASVTADPPVEQRTVRALATLLAKRTFDMFAQNHGQKPPLDEGRCACGVSTPANRPCLLHIPPALQLGDKNGPLPS